MDEHFLNKVSSVLRINRLFINQACVFSGSNKFPHFWGQKAGAPTRSASWATCFSYSSLPEDSGTEQFCGPLPSLVMTSLFPFCISAKVKPNGYIPSKGSQPALVRSKQGQQLSKALGGHVSKNLLKFQVGRHQTLARPFFFFEVDGSL